MRIWKKHKIDDSSTEWHSCCLHNQLDLCWGKLTSKILVKNCKNHKKFNAVVKSKEQSNHKLTLMLSFLLVFLFFVPRDHQQITFVTTNRFCNLSKTSNPLFLMDYIKLDGIPSKIKWKIHASFTLYLKFWRYFF